MEPRPSAGTAAHPPRAPAGARTEVFCPRVLGWSAGLLFAPLFVASYLLLVPEPPVPRWLGAAVVGLDLLLAGVIIGRRSRNRIELSPRGVLAMDDAGTHQVEWAQVRRVEWVGMDDVQVALVTHTGARIVLELQGYRDRDQVAIWQRVRGHTSS